MLDTTKLINKITYNGKVVDVYSQNTKDDMFWRYIDKTLDKLDDANGYIKSVYQLPIFSDFKNLSYVKLPAFSSYLSNYTFSNCTSLETAYIPNTTSIPYCAFYNCYNLKTINVNATRSIYVSAFTNCSALQTISLPNCSEILYTAFSNCISLETIDAPNTINFSQSSSGCTFYNCQNLKSIYFPKWAEGSTSYIGYQMFYNCYNLSTITLPSTLTNISTRAFYNCYNLDQSCIDFSKLISINDSAFYNCSKITDINNLNSKITTLDGQFRGTGIINLSLPYVTRVNAYAFQNCKNLKTVNLPNCSIINSYAFAGCSSLETVSLASNLQYLSASTFINCINLSNIEIPSSISEITASSVFYNTGFINLSLPSTLKKLGEHTFRNCTKLETLNTGGVERFAHYSTFEGCMNLKEALLPNVISTYYSTFANCINLSVVLLNKIGNIYGCTFLNCSNLSVICITANSVATLSASDAFYGTPITNSTFLSAWGSIYVPASLVSTYQARTNWAHYKSRITSIENLPEEYKQWLE